MNDLNKIYLKTAEELAELVARLLQNVNKKKDYTDKIYEEIEDIEKQIKLLKIELSKFK
jgi:uncharacterized protein Yka (UPF0111/DUF47 family)